MDLLLERDGRFFPIEIKLGTRPTRDDLRGIGALRNTYPNLDFAPGLVICPVERFQRLGETDYALPWDSR